jgi:hypothetical protein
VQNLITHHERKEAGFCMKYFSCYIKRSKTFLRSTMDDVLCIWLRELQRALFQNYTSAVTSRKIIKLIITTHLHSF